MIYLYKKTHNKTGLKYLGKTISKDPYTYSGSGVYWTRHDWEKENKNAGFIGCGRTKKNSCAKKPPTLRRC